MASAFNTCSSVTRPRSIKRAPSGIFLPLAWLANACSTCSAVTRPAAINISPILARGDIFFALIIRLIVPSIVSCGTFSCSEIISPTRRSFSLFCSTRALSTSSLEIAPLSLRISPMGLNWRRNLTNRKVKKTYLQTLSFSMETPIKPVWKFWPPGTLTLNVLPILVSTSSSTPLSKFKPG